MLILSLNIKQAVFYAQSFSQLCCALGKVFYLPEIIRSLNYCVNSDIDDFQAVLNDSCAFEPFRCIVIQSLRFLFDADGVLR